MYNQGLSGEQQKQALKSALKLEWGKTELCEQIRKEEEEMLT